MKVSIYGVGYVGLVTGVCLAKLGHHVCCFDIDEQKINGLQQGIVPIYEENLEAFLSEVMSSNAIKFTANFNETADYSVLHIIAVGTPPQADGSADLSHVLDVATRLSQVLKNDAVIVNKSTVPVGTADRVSQIMGPDFTVVSNPEFLKEGKAIEDFMNPDRIIVGTNDPKAASLLRELYAPLNAPVLLMSPRAAELTKYASNAFLATKISFMNEMSLLAERLGADIDEVKRGMGYDSRIGDQFLNPGCGYGGSCFPKDVSALHFMAQQSGLPSRMLDAVQQVNQHQKSILFQKISHYFNGDLNGRRVAVWGLAFKPGTDDIREAPSLTLLSQLFEAGAIVQAYDPMAMQNVRRYFSDSAQLDLKNAKEAALEEAHVLVILTEWSEFLKPDFSAIKASLHQPIIFDGRNIYDPNTVSDYGLQYCGIGRGLTVAADYASA